MKHNLDNITSQKWGARHIGEPHDHKSGGLEPLGPIGVYAYDGDAAGVSTTAGWLSRRRPNRIMSDLWSLAMHSSRKKIPRAPRVHTSNSIWIGSCVFAKLTLTSNEQRTDTQKDHTTRVTIGRILCCFAIQPSNIDDNNARISEATTARIVSLPCDIM